MKSEYEAAILAAGHRRSAELYNPGYGFILDDDRWQDRRRRESFAREYGFAIPNDEALKAIAEFAPILEIGAGTGYWAYELRKRGVDIAATDRQPGVAYGFEKTWTRVEKKGWRAALHAYPGRTLLLSWPCYEREWATRAVRHHRGKYVVFVGEGPGGCTGAPSLFDLFDSHFIEERTISIPQWWGIHDYLTVYRRVLPCFAGKVAA